MESVNFETKGATGERSLPRGPHRLSRAEVEGSQRERLLSGVTEAVATKGYAATAVADILKLAGVSRTTFYQLFPSKLECFLAASRLAAEAVATAMAAELARLEAGGCATPLGKLDALLDVYLRSIAAEPEVARVFLVEVYAAGPRAIEQRRVSLEQFVDLVVATHGEGTGVLGPTAQQRFAAELLVGAVSSKVTTAVGLGDAASLPSLHGPMLDFAARVLGETPPR
jgi:AcrR family transcriptional regulator